MRRQYIVIASIIWIWLFALMFFLLFDSKEINKNHWKKETVKNVYNKKLEENKKKVVKEENYNKFFQQAIENQDKSMCEKIIPKDIKKDCLKSLKRVIIYNEAINNLDKAKCNKIDNKEIQKSCKNLVEESVKQLKEQDKEYVDSILKANSKDELINNLEEQLKKYPNNIDIYLKLALLYADKWLKMQEAGKDQTPYVNKAFELLKKAQEIDPQDPEVYRVRWYAYEIKPDLQKAIDMYNKSISIYSWYVLAYVWRWHTYNMMWMLEKAVEDLRKAADLDKDKKYIAVYAQLCRLLAWNDKYIEEAIKNCNIAINMSWTVEDIESKSDSYQVLASIYNSRKEYEKAIEYIEKAKQLTPNDKDLYVIEADIYINQGKYKLAEQSARKAISISPIKSTAYEKLAYSLYQQWKFEEAIEKALKWIELVEKDVSLLSPNKAFEKKKLYYILANIYHQMKNVELEKKYKKLWDNAFNF